VFRIERHIHFYLLNYILCIHKYLVCVCDNKCFANKLTISCCFLHWADFYGELQCIVMCLEFLTTSDYEMWRVGVLETPFRLLLSFIYDFTSRHYNTFTMWRELGWLRVHFRVESLSFAAELIWLFVSYWPWFHWSDVASLIGPGSTVLILRLWSALVPLFWYCVSDWPWFLCSDITSLIGFFDLLGFIAHRPVIGCWRLEEKTPCRRVTFHLLFKLSRE
jgi:hypothetical protein